jgi:hypothetical protein
MRAALLLLAFGVACSAPPAPPALPPVVSTASAVPIASAMPSTVPIASTAATVAPMASAPPPPPKTDCESTESLVPLIVDRGPPDHADRLGPPGDSPVDSGPRVRTTLAKLAVPKNFDAYNFAMYLPYYAADAYQEAVATRGAFSGAAQLEIALDEQGQATTVAVTAPGLPKEVVGEIRERATTRHETCGPLAAGAKVRATLTFAPRPPRSR